MRLQTSVALAAVMIAMPAEAAPAPGVYSNVCLSPDTGDQGGVELDLSYKAGKPVVALKLCEGGCWAERTHTAKTARDALTFVATQQFFDEKGAPLPTEDYHFSASFSGATAILESPDRDGYARLRLKRQKFKSSALTDPRDPPTPVGRC